MAIPAIDHSIEIEKRTNFYLERIRKIDSILEGPALTLISIAAEGLPKEKSSGLFENHRVYFPTWISETVKPERVDHLLTQALCSSTLQRLWRLRRRFPWLDKHSRFEEIHELLVRSLIPEDLREFKNCIKGLNSRTFGCLNPLTASQVFRVFLSAGEDHAHGVMGFLAFFAMVWPLYRRFPDPLNIGASIEPWEPTTYVTANCLLPIKTLQSICRKRARLLGRIATNIKKLSDLATQPAQRERWLFNLELDDLSSNLERLSEVAIVREEFRKCAEFVGAHSDNTTVASENTATYEAVLQSVGQALLLVGERSTAVLAQARSITNSIQEEIIRRLPDPDKHPTDPDREGDYQYLETWGFKFAKEFIDDHSQKEKYWGDLRQAAVKSLELCQKAWDRLQAGAENCLNVTVNDPNSIIDTITLVKILFDEIDDLLRQRNSETARRFQPRFMDLVVPAMLNRLGDLRSACRRQEICFLLGTNYVEKIEPALIRSGRIDRCVAVVYPDRHSRLAMIGRHSDSMKEQSQKQKKPEETAILNGIVLVLDSLADHIASSTKQWPWMTIDSTCKDISKNEELKKRVEETLTNKGAVLTGVLTQSNSPFEKIINAALAINQSSFSEPEYGVLRWGDRFSPQLLDEYLHHLMSRFDDLTEYENHLRKEAKEIEPTGKVFWHKGIEFVINRAKALWKQRENDLR
jgi:hypothetical protein